MYIYIYISIYDCESAFSKYSENVKNDDESNSFSQSDKESKPKPGRTKCAIALEAMAPLMP